MRKKNNHNFTNMKFIQLVISVFAVYAVSYQAIVQSQYWFKPIYSAESFVSIRPIHMGLWAAVALMMTVAVDWYGSISKKDKWYLLVKLITVTAIAGLFMWFFFDATLRLFVTLPEAIEQPMDSEFWVNNDAGTLTPNTVFPIVDIIVSIWLIYTTLKHIAYVIDNKIDVKKNAKVIATKIKWIEKATIFSLGFLILVQAGVWFTFILDGYLDVVNRPFPVIGLRIQVPLTIIGMYLAHKRFIFLRREEGVENPNKWKFNIVSTLLLALLLGYTFHDNWVFVTDYLFEGGKYHYLFGGGSISLVSKFFVGGLIVGCVLNLGVIILNLYKIYFFAGNMEYKKKERQ